MPCASIIMIFIEISRVINYKKQNFIYKNFPFSQKMSFYYLFVVIVYKVIKSNDCKILPPSEKCLFHEGLAKFSFYVLQWN